MIIFEDLINLFRINIKFIAKIITYCMSDKPYYINNYRLYTYKCLKRSASLELRVTSGKGGLM